MIDSRRALTGFRRVMFIIIMKHILSEFEQIKHVDLRRQF